MCVHSAFVRFWVLARLGSRSSSSPPPHLRDAPKFEKRGGAPEWSADKNRVPLISSVCAVSFSRRLNRRPALTAFEVECESKTNSLSRVFVTFRSQPIRRQHLLASVCGSAVKAVLGRTFQNHYGTSQAAVTQQEVVWQRRAALKVAFIALPVLRCQRLRGRVACLMIWGFSVQISWTFVSG